MSFEDDWDFDRTQEDRDRAHKELKEAMHMDPTSIQDVVALMAMSRREEYGYFPLMQYLFDAYTRTKVHLFLRFGYAARLSNCFPQKWMEMYNFGLKIKKRNETDKFTKDGVPPIYRWMVCI